MTAALTSSTGDILIGSGVLVLLVALAAVVLWRTRRIELKAGRIEANLNPNGGASVRDLLDRLEVGQREIHRQFNDRLDVLEAKFDEHSRRLAELEQPAPTPPKRVTTPKRRTS